MKTRNLLLGLSFMGSLAMTQTVVAATFARAGVWHLYYTNDSFDSTFGGSAAMGLQFGPLSDQEISLEIGYAGWEFERPSNLAPGLGVRGDGHVMPIQLNYRYTFQNLRGIRPYVGGSFGMARISGDVNVAASGVISVGNASEYEAAYSGFAGITGAITDQMSWEAGYRYLWIDKTELESRSFAGTAGWLPGPKIPFPGLRAHALTAAVVFRF